MAVSRREFCSILAGGALAQKAGNEVVVLAPDASRYQVKARGGSTARTLASHFADVVNVRDYGAVGDGVADDADAIQASLEAGATTGRSVFLPSGDYSLSKALSLSSFTHRLSILADNAKIVLNSSNALESVLCIDDPKADVFIDGLSIDANRLAYVGLMIQKKDEIVIADLTINCISIKNVYRSGKIYNYGDGIFIQGEFRNLRIINPIIKNCTMSSGSGSYGTYGIFGISILRLENGGLQGKSSDNVYIENPYIENIYCEDSNYIYDQDGMRVFTNYIPNSNFNNPDTVAIYGGYFKNIRGRAVKIQTHNATIDGVTIVHTGSICGFSGVIEGKSELDLQVGFGNISNITYIAQRIICQTLLRVRIDERETMELAGMNIANIRADVVIAEDMPAKSTPDLYVVFDNVKAACLSSINITNLNVKSDEDYCHAVNVLSAGNVFVNVSNIAVPVDTATIRLGGTGNIHATAVNIANTGSTQASACVVQNSSRHTASVLNTTGALS